MFTCDDCGVKSNSVSYVGDLGITSEKSPYGAYLCNDCKDQAISDLEITENICIKENN